MRWEDKFFSLFYYFFLTLIIGYGNLLKVKLIILPKTQVANALNLCLPRSKRISLCVLVWT